MPEPIRNITIVGGGTSGWLAALFLATHFRDRIDAGDMAITLVESPRVPIIGVGESLAPSMPETLQQLGLSEKAFILETDASFKLAGYFPGWDVGADGKPTSWVNPFVAYTTAGYEFERFELEGKPFGEAPDYARVISPCREAIEQGLGPRRMGQGDFDFVLRYAYHTDAGKFAPFLQRHAEARGAVRILDDVLDAELDERGFVSALLLEQAGRLPVELVIDATGFQGVLLHGKLGVPRLDYGDQLLNDRAVVTQLAHAEDSEIEPATRSTALDSGWAFRVPLYTRTGNGYIFSSTFTSDDEAADRFARHLGPAARAENMRVIRMNVGRAARTWEKNVIALGLSAGFVEPLEASAIYSVEHALRWLLNFFPDSSFPPVLADRFNERTAQLFDEVVDYIVLHYRLSNRQDTPYWRAQRNERTLSDRLAANLDLWRYTLPSRADFASTNYFDQNTYTAALFGKGFYTGGQMRPGVPLRRDEWETLKGTIANTHAQALASLPGHKALLTTIRTRAAQ